MQKKIRKTALMMALLMSVMSMPFSGRVSAADSDGQEQKSASIEYVQAMGEGWNLGNSFDGFDSDWNTEDKGEQAWGNPEVTKELIQAVKAKGYDSIRMPFTCYRRYSEEDGKYVLDQEYLQRYKEVVDWAVEEDMYVMVNMHHDSWIWLSAWDGNIESDEYKIFCDLWEQLADTFKDEGEKVCLETINEPSFSATGDITAQDKLNAINLAAYNIIRNSGGNNDTRMIVMPTLNTNHEQCDPLKELIESLNDENIIATCHYYSEWVFSANLGKVGFEEDLWGNGDYTPKDAVDSAFTLMDEAFTQNGIGVVIGEYGLLGYDSAYEVNETGEELKYYEYINYVADEKDMCLMFWDNGSGINRETYEWKKPLVGEMLESCMEGRSSYATCFDNLYFKDAEDIKDVEIPLTLNGNEFVGIEGLTEGTDYTYNSETQTVTILQSFVEAKFNEKGSETGEFAELVFDFDKGMDWHEYFIKYSEMVFDDAEGTTDLISIPVQFNGSKVMRATANMVSGRVGPNSSWWAYLQYGSSYAADYEKGTIDILKTFFDDSSVVDGEIEFVIECYDGSVYSYVLTKEGSVVTGDKDKVVEELPDPTCAPVICIYTGETEIPAQYLSMSEGACVYGTYPWDKPEFLTLTGWPATITFGTTAQEGSIFIGLLITQGGKETYIDNIQMYLKDAPKVSDVTVHENETANVIVENLAEDAVLSYRVEGSSAVVSEDGVITGVEAGTATVIVTVTQYGRTDEFSAVVTVEEEVIPEPETPSREEIIEEAVIEILTKVKELISKIFELIGKFRP